MKAKHLKKIEKGFLMETYEIIFCRYKKTWQIWHPELGFMAAYREKERAIEYCKTLIN
jgi:hypothetical protein